MSFIVRHVNHGASAAGNEDSQVVEPRRVHQQPFPRTRHDVYHTAFLLRQVLVDDLVVFILDLAEYWLAESSHSDTRVNVGPAGWKREAKQVLSSPSLPQDWDYHRIRKIVIKIQSQDQGWSDYKKHHGTYRHSASWFEVGIANGNEPYATCVLQPNMHAGLFYTIHEIIWRSDSAHDLELQWIKGLDKDKPLMVNALAQFPGWANYFKSGRIDVYFAAVTRL